MRVMESVFGIHVGNSSACVAFFKDGKIDVIADDSGNRIMPAIVAFIEGEEIVGLPAKAALIRNAASTIVRNKKLINISLSDNDLEEHIKSTRCKIVTEGSVKYEINSGDRSAYYTPESAMTSIYKKLCGYASTCVPPDSDLRAVICAPLHFSPSSRQLLARAAEDAGFDVLQVISEPAAVLLAQGLSIDSPDYKGTCLVYRLGGATLDVTVMSCCGGMYTVESEVQRRNIGGDKFTEILANFLAEVFHQKWKLDPNESRRAMAKLFDSAAQCKHILSTMSTAHCFIESLCEGIDFSYNVTRARFENLITPELKPCTDPIEEALKLANVRSEDIDKVVLCGGSVKIPLLQHTISEIFPKKEVLCSVNPDELIAIGAAKHGSFLTEPFDPNYEHLYYDIKVVTKSIYLKINEALELVISAQTPVPTKVTKTFPMKDVEGPIQVHVIEADEHENTAFEDGALLLGTIVLPDCQSSTGILAEIFVNSIGSLNVSIAIVGTQTKETLRLSPPDEI